MIIAKNKSSDFYRVPPGTYIGRCYSVIDFGTYATAFQGKERMRREVRLTWEIPSEQIVRDGEQKPASLSKTYTLSLNEKSALRKDLESWRGKSFSEEELDGFDLAKLLGAACTLTVSEKPRMDGALQAVITGIGRLGKGMECAPRYNPTFEYSATEGRTAKYDSLPEWAREKISRCMEWTAPPPDVAHGPEESTEQPADDVPF